MDLQAGSNPTSDPTSASHDASASRGPLTIHIPSLYGASRRHVADGGRIHIGLNKDGSVIVDPDGRKTHKSRELTIEGTQTGWRAVGPTSEGGTKVNGVELVPPLELRSGDVLRLGCRGEFVNTGRALIRVTFDATAAEGEPHAALPKPGPEEAERRSDAGVLMTVQLDEPDSAAAATEERADEASAAAEDAALESSAVETAPQEEAAAEAQAESADAPEQDLAQEQDEVHEPDLAQEQDEEQEPDLAQEQEELHEPDLAQEQDELHEPELAQEQDEEQEPDLAQEQDELHEPELAQEQDEEQEPDLAQEQDELHEPDLAQEQDELHEPEPAQDQDEEQEPDLAQEQDELHEPELAQEQDEEQAPDLAQEPSDAAVPEAAPLHEFGTRQTRAAAEIVPQHAAYPAAGSRSEVLAELVKTCIEIGQVKFQLEDQLLRLSRSAIETPGIDVDAIPLGHDLLEVIDLRGRLGDEIEELDSERRDHIEFSEMELSELTAAIVPLRTAHQAAVQEANEARRQAAQANDRLSELSRGVAALLRPVIGEVIDLLLSDAPQSEEPDTSVWPEWAAALQLGAEAMIERHKRVEAARETANAAAARHEELVELADLASSELGAAVDAEATTRERAQLEKERLERRLAELREQRADATQRERELRLEFSARELKDDSSPIAALEGFDHARRLNVMSNELQAVLQVLREQV